MTKVQKIWLGVFLAMFILPEIIWGPLLGIIAKYSSFNLLPIIKDSQLVNDNAVIMNIILLSEIIGLGGLCTLIFVLAKKKKPYMIIMGLVSAIFFVVLILAAYLYNSLDKFLS